MPCRVVLLLRWTMRTNLPHIRLCLKCLGTRRTYREQKTISFLGRNIILVRELTSLIRRITEVESCPILFGNRLYTLWIAARCFQMLENKGSRPEYFFQSYMRRNLIERVIFIYGVEFYVIEVSITPGKTSLNTVYMFKLLQTFEQFTNYKLY